MESIAKSPQHGLERYHFALRRLHSLTGGIPLGAFLVEHMLTNFGVVVGGPPKYNEDVGLLQSIPWLPIFEWVFIFLPLAFHGGYGFFITVTGKSNLSHYRYGGNLRYTLQRVTGLIAAVFVVVHLLKYRFNYLLPGGHHFDWLNATAATAEGLANPWVVAFYVVGVLAVVYHFANGLWTGLITWGVTLGARSQRRAGYLCAAVGLALGAMGLASLFWFHFKAGAG